MHSRDAHILERCVHNHSKWNRGTPLRTKTPLRRENHPFAFTGPLFNATTQRLVARLLTYLFHSENVWEKSPRVPTLPKRFNIHHSSIDCSIFSCIVIISFFIFVIACESAPPCVTERKYTDRYILDDDLDCATSFLNCFFSKAV